MVTFPLIAALGQVVFQLLLSAMAIFLILLVLVQRGRGGGLAGALGGMGGSSAFGAKAGDVFTRVTIVAAAVWIFLCIVAANVTPSSESRINTGPAAPASSGFGGGSAMTGPVTEDQGIIPLGKGIIRRPGNDVTLITYSRMTYECMEAARELAKKGVQAEVIDLRTLSPLDFDLIAESIKKTRHAVVVHEACRTGGFGSELSARVSEELFDHLDGPVVRVAAKDVPMPFSPVMEKFVMPQITDIFAAVDTVLKR